MRNRRDIAALLGALSLTLAGCSRGEPAAVETATAPDYLQFISLRDELREEPNATHKEPITDRAGKTWYREPGIGANLNDVRLGEVTIAPTNPGDPSGEWTLTLRFREESIDTVTSWCEPRIGRPVGLVIGGELVLARPMAQSMVGRVRYPLPLGEAEISEVRRRIRAGGEE